MDQAIKQVITLLVFMIATHFSSFVVNGGKPFSFKQMWFNVLGYSIGLISFQLMLQ